MPGLLAAVGEFPLERVRAAARKLEHLTTNDSEALTLAPGVALGWVGHAASFDRASWSQERGRTVHVWRYGHTFRDGAAPAVVAAADILADYLARGVDACYEYDGSFVIAVADLRNGRLFIVPDRLCTQPVQYAVEGERVVVAPEVKALGAMLAKAAALSPEGVVGFLSAGYNIGAQTLFEGVQRLEMGKMLEISLERPRRVATRRFWKLDFTTEKFRDRNEAQAALFDAMMSSHRLLLADKPKFQILLSGGLDSRGMLGACSLLGIRPAQAVTWGLSDDLPRSDAAVAKALAKHFGVPFQFISTHTREFIDNCETWSYVSELSNDNFGWYTEGFGTLRHMHETGMPCSLIGDEGWGCQGYAYSEQQAHEKVLPGRVPAAVLALMPPSRRDAATASYLDNLHATMRDCADENFNDRKDFLYLHGRVARFIFALGYYRGHVTEHRRPYLTRGVLDVVRRMTPEMRVYKILYLTVLKRRMPETMHAPHANVPSLPDWKYDLRTDPALKECFLSLLHDPLIETGVLGGILDRRALGDVRDAFFAETPTPVSRTPSRYKIVKRRLGEALWRSPLYAPLDRLLYSQQDRPLARAIAAPIDILRRVAIIVLLERQLHRFGDADYRAQDSREPTPIAV